jgi:hypothetical protein
MPSEPAGPRPRGKTRFLEALQEAGGDTAKLKPVHGAPYQTQAHRAQIETRVAGELLKPKPGTEDENVGAAASRLLGELRHGDAVVRGDSAKDEAKRRRAALASSPLVKRMAADQPPDPQAFKREAEEALASKEEPSERQPEPEPGKPDDRPDELDDLIRF